MTEDNKISQNTEEEEVLVNLTLDPEEEPAPQDDLNVNGTHKSHKKKKSSKLYAVIIVLLLGVMGYSGYQIVSTLLERKEAEDVYDNIMDQFLVEGDDPFIDPEWTEPEQPEQPEETSDQTKASADPQESRVTKATQESQAADESEESVSLVTVEADPETTAHKTTAAQKTTAAASTPKDPMRILNVNFTSLKKVNKDVVAWLQGLGGAVNYPVVQGKNNSYYLKHLIDGTKNVNGTLFVHCENKFMKDDITYIFGHHMKSGMMFGHLTDYRSESYYYKNLDLRLYTPGKIYNLKVVYVILGTATEKITLNFANADAFNRTMNSYASRTLHPSTVSVSYGDKMVCLCTCSHLQNDGRMFVFCKVMNPD